MDARPRLTRSALLRGGLGALGAGAGAAALTGLAGCSDDGGTPTSAPTRSGGPVSATSSTTSSTSSPEPTEDPTQDPTQDPVPATVSVRVAQTLATGLVVPWGIAFLPDGDALVSSRDTAHVLRVGRRGGARVVGTVPDVVSNVSEGGEAGLLGLALHPAYPEEPWLYAYRSTATDNQVVRMRYAGGRLGRPQVLLDGIRRSVHHNGGGLAFGAGGSLFVSTGDAEVSSDAPDPSSLNGKVLRIADDGSVPDGNPFGDSPVWSVGHRNVEGLALDGRTLWASEFGDKGADELNRIVPGDDYGWPAVEGGDGPGGYHDPLATWATDDCSPSGIAIAAGRAWLGALQGECVYAVVVRGPHTGRVGRFLTGRYGRIRSVAAAPDGSLWVGTSNRDGRTTPRSGDDRLLRVTLT